MSKPKSAAEFALAQPQAYKDRLLVQLLALASDSGDVGFWEGDEDEPSQYIYCRHSGDRYGEIK